MSIGNRGILYIVATPIGNLGDLSSRALEVLSGVDVIAAEDTRRSGQLLRHFGIATKCIALHDHNEREVSPRMIEALCRGESVALISDAGTPLISDPGFHLVRSARDAGLPVVPVPGPSALIAALSVAGLPADRFVFEGFLPPRMSQRQRRLNELRDEPRTLVFYEAPHRIVETLEDLVQAFGADREAVYVREVTKLHETTLHGSLGGLSEQVGQDPMQQKGEIVLVVRGVDEAAAVLDESRALQTLALLLEELPLKKAAGLAAKLTGARRNWLYERGLELQQTRK